MKYLLILLLFPIHVYARGISNYENYDTFNVLVSIFTIIWLPSFFISMKKNGNKENWANNAFSGLVGVYGLLLAFPFSIKVLFDSNWGFITTAICIVLVLYDNLKAK